MTSLIYELLSKSCIFFQSSLRYSPQVGTDLSQNILDTRELQNEANAQLQSIKLQQMMLQSRAKQWVQQQQQQVCESLRMSLSYQL